MDDEVSLRDLAEIFKRHRRLLIFIPLLFVVLAGIYVFFFATPVYESKAAFGVAPFEVNSQLESKIRVQYRLPISYASLEALALSQEVVSAVWQELVRSGDAEKGWGPIEDDVTSTEAFRRSLDFKDLSGDPMAAGNSSQVVVELSVRSRDPEVAARAANLWANKLAEKVNALSRERLEYALDNLGQQLDPAREELKRQEAAWEAFNSSSSLEQDKKELASKTQAWVSLDAERDKLQRTLAELEGRLKEIENQLEVQARVVSPGASTLYLTLLNRSVGEAKKALASSLEEARAQYEASAKELEAFDRAVQLDALKSRLDALRGRLDGIYVRQSKLDTTRASLEAALDQVAGELEKTPEFLELTRDLELGKDTKRPLRTLGLDQLSSLKLKVESINPLYAPLFNKVVDLKTELDKLAAEKTALDEEYARVKEAYDALNEKYVAAKRQRGELLIRLGSDESLYKTYLELYDRLPPSVSDEYTFRNDNPEYNRLVSEMTDVRISQARTQARLAMVEKQLELTQARIDELKGKVARSEVELNEISRNLKLARETYTALASERKDLQIELSGSQDIAQVLARAYPVFDPVAPRKLFTLALAFMLGVMLAVVLVLLKAALEPPQESGSEAGLAASD